MATPTLDEIAAHGNRGHNHADNNWITCADGTQLSVIAGGGTNSWPRVAYCYCAMPLVGDQFPPHPPTSGEWPHDYPGPYTDVEVLHGPKDGGNDDVTVEFVSEVRSFIESHGGER